MLLDRLQRAFRSFPFVDTALLVLSAPVIFSGAMYGPALPLWIDAFASTAPTHIASTWALAAPALFIALGIPTFQRVEAELGFVRMLGVGCAFVFLSGAVGMLAQSIWLLLLSRAIVGVGAAALLVGTTSILAKRHVGRERKVWLSRQAGVMTFAGLAGTLAVGALSTWEWRAAFLLPMVGLPAFGLSSWLGSRAATLWRPRYFAEREVIAYGAPPLLALPLVTPPSVQAKRTARTRWKLFVFGLTGAVGLMHYFAVIQLLCTEITRDFGFSPWQTGGVLASLMAGGGVSAWQASRLPRVLSYPRSLTVGFSVAAVGLLLLSVSSNIWAMAAVLILTGLGFGCIRPVLGWWLHHSTQDYQRARSLTFVSAAYYLGISCSPLFILWVRDWRRLLVLSACWLIFVACSFLILSFRRGWNEVDLL